MGTGFTLHRLLERGELELVVQEMRRLYGVNYILHYTEQAEICTGLANNFLRYLHVRIYYTVRAPLPLMKFITRQ